MTKTITLNRYLDGLGDAVAETYTRTLAEADKHIPLIQNAAAEGKDRLAIGGASQILCTRRDPAHDTTIAFAAQELERIIELNGAGLTNPSQREFANSVREDRHSHARRILVNILEDPAITKFWEERAHYHRPPQLTIQERRELGHLIRHYFERLPTVEGEVEKLRQVALDPQHIL